MFFLKNNKFASFFLFLLVLVAPNRCVAGEKLVGVLLSREIAPYVSMVEGLESRFSATVQRFFLDEAGKPYSLTGRNATLTPQMYDVLVAVGPEALQYLQSRAGGIPLIHGMVLNARKLIIDPQWQPCGVGLSIPAEAQLASILRSLPAIKRLGVLFDPGNNQGWFKSAAVLAAAKGFELVPLQVNRQGGKLEMVGDFARLDAILFIPDKSIISKAVIQYVIKQGALNHTPVIGYNQFFYDSGAALIFLIDYRKVGQQVARQVELILAGEKCEGEHAPQYEAVLNDEVWRALKKGQKSEGRSQNE